MCHFDGCTAQQYCRGYCRAHYYKLHRYGDPGAGVRYRQRPPRCQTEGCSGDAMIKGPDAGFCEDHRRYCPTCGQRRA